MVRSLQPRPVNRRTSVSTDAHESLVCPAATTWHAHRVVSPYHTESNRIAEIHCSEMAGIRRNSESPVRQAWCAAVSTRASRSSVPTLATPAGAETPRDGAGEEQAISQVRKTANTSRALRQRAVHADGLCGRSIVSSRVSAIRQGLAPTRAPRASPAAHAPDGERRRISARSNRRAWRRSRQPQPAKRGSVVTSETRPRRMFSERTRANGDCRT